MTRVTTSHTSIDSSDNGTRGAYQNSFYLYKWWFKEVEPTRIISGNLLWNQLTIQSKGLGYVVLFVIRDVNNLMPLHLRLVCLFQKYCKHAQFPRIFHTCQRLTRGVGAQFPRAFNTFQKPTSRLYTAGYNLVVSSSLLCTAIPLKTVDASTGVAVLEGLQLMFKKGVCYLHKDHCLSR
jgi:hypothetical protein